MINALSNSMTIIVSIIHWWAVYSSQIPSSGLIYLPPGCWEYWPFMALPSTAAENASHEVTEVTPLLPRGPNQSDRYADTQEQPPCLIKLWRPWLLSSVGAAEPPVTATWQDRHFLFPVVPPQKDCLQACLQRVIPGKPFTRNSPFWSLFPGNLF